MLLCKPTIEKSSSQELSKGGQDVVKLVLLLVDPECLTPENLHLILIKIFKKIQDSPTFFGSFTISQTMRFTLGS